MQAARVLVASLAVLAAGGVLGSAAAQTADPVRQRAEQLAEDASRRFSEVLKGDRVAQAQGKQPAAPPRAGSDDPWTAVLQWMEHSNREYQRLIRRLSQGGAGTVAPASPPAVKPGVAPAVVASKPQAKAPPPQETADWLTRSGERFQSIMSKLAEKAAPPPKQMPAPDAGKVAGEAGKTDTSKAPPAPKSPPSVAPDVEPSKATEERRLAEAAKREAEVRKTEEALQAAQAKKTAEPKAAEEARTAAETKRSAEAKAVEDARRAAEAKQAEVAKKEEVRKAEEAKRTAEAKTAEARTAEEAKRAAAARQVEETRKAEEALRVAQAKRAVDEKAARERLAEEARKAEQAKRAPKTPGALKTVDAAKTPTQRPPAGVSGPPAEKAPKAARVASAPETARRHEGGRRLYASRSCETAGSQVKPPGWYVVKAGDTLWDIAQRHYGTGWRYKRIHAANRRRIHRASYILPCQRVYLPPRGRRA